jgi:TPP-dependent pyruvate/acetoin dehydrogenase alpha subunit
MTTASRMDAGAVGLDREALVALYEKMVLTRAVEERGIALFRQGRIPGSYYTGRGNEAGSVGVAAAMGPADVGTPLHRNLGVHLTRGVEPWRVFAQYMGRVDGPTRGRESSVHMGDPDLGMIAMVSHLPAMLPVAVGAALAFRITRAPRVAVAWFGEGAAARGDAHEGMNLAGVRRLPVVFICDNNQWAYTTPTHLSYACEHIADRARGYGFDGLVVDGTDVVAVYRAARAAIEKARAGGGPTLIESVTMRMQGHGIHDDAAYVPAEMLAAWAERDPLERHRDWLRAHLGFSDDEEAAVHAAVAELVAESVERAGRSPLPARETMTGGVYA